MKVRQLHPGAWWLWALLLAAAASRTTDLLLLGLICAVAGVMVVSRGGEGSRRTFRIYLLVGLFVLVVRVAFRMVLGGGGAGDVIFTLPELRLPDWAVGIRVGGPVTASEISGGLADGARLATLIICVGAANTLADPRRLLRSLPLALHSVGTAVVVAISLVPQLVASVFRVRRAAALRSVNGRRLRLRRFVGPVIDDALSRTLSLAIAMEVRGFGRPLGPSARPVFAVTTVSLLTTLIGLYLVLDGGGVVGPLLLATGLGGAALGLRAAGQRRRVTVYRPDPWRRAEWLVAGLGAFVLMTLVAIGRVDGAALHPEGLTGTPVVGMLVVAAAAIPAWLGPARSQTGGLQPS